MLSTRNILLNNEKRYIQERGPNQNPQKIRKGEIGKRRKNKKKQRKMALIENVQFNHHWIHS